MPEQPEHPDIPPDDFDDEPGFEGPSVEAFGQGLPDDFDDQGFGKMPDDVRPVDPDDHAPVNPESPEDLLDDTLNEFGLPRLPSIGEGPIESQEEYGSYDPTDHVDGPKPDPTLRAEDGTILPAFDPKHREDFEGLLYLGALTKGFTWLGHKFRVRTLTADELLAVTRVTQPYDQTMGAALAYKTAMVAMTVTTVDGQELPIPYAAQDDAFEWAQQRFDYVKSKWFQFTIEAVYTEYLELEAKANAVVMAMGKVPVQPVLMTG